MAPRTVNESRPNPASTQTTSSSSVDRAPAADSTTAEVAENAPTPTLTEGQLTQSSLFDLFWRSNQAGMSRGGLDELTRDGVETLHAHALAHEVDGSPTQGPGKIDKFEKAVIRSIVDHHRYGGLIEVDARPLLLERFGLEPESVSLAKTLPAPVRAGTLTEPSALPPHDRAILALHRLEELPSLLTLEYERRREWFEDPKASEETRGMRTLELLAQFSEALWWRGQKPNSDAVAHRLLDAYEKLPFAQVVGSKDYTGAGWGIAQNLVLGGSTRPLHTRFPPTKRPEWTYLSMHDHLTSALSLVDDYREALGLPRGATALDQASVFADMFGEEVGNTMGTEEELVTALDERRPFWSTGLNWGRLLFPGDDEIARLRVRTGFEFPIDFMGGNGSRVKASPSPRAWWGDRLTLADVRGRPLTAEKVIDRDEHGQALAWAARFRDAEGNEVAPADVRARVEHKLAFKGIGSQGDGRFDGLQYTSWWGFCDRNASQGVIKAQYGLPELDRDVELRIPGTKDKRIRFPREQAQQLIDADLKDLAPNGYLGFRFDGDLAVGSRGWFDKVSGTLEPFPLNPADASERDGDVLVWKLNGERPVHAVVRLPDELTFEAAETGGGSDAKQDGAKAADKAENKAEKKQNVVTRTVVRLEQDAATGEVTLVHSPESNKPPFTGRLLTQLPWDAARVVDGKRILEVGANLPVSATRLALRDGSSIPLSELWEVRQSTKEELRLSQALLWVAERNGLFGSDSATGDSVSNGMRWIDELSLGETTGDERPDDVHKGPLWGVDGPLSRQPGDKMIWARGLLTDSGTKKRNAVFAGWIQVGPTGRILNEGFTHGAFDFGWSPKGNLNWNAPSTYNRFLLPELRLKLFVNGVSDQAVLDRLAEQGDLPKDWRKHLE